ncbi:hypothetical protein SNE25_04660 [Mucilaginibacter sabulilitoris]|uniref:DUF3945 domain-containing protein n=1 Tax=Mucilaginibacter sabulilitoris TaxID=1173583 RepID=A0ABZ0TPI7_9SPHI|nr:hypothetical protein [Mucilaginibacter sabulilitoris]WPU94812.1 hypothetical protein SNE25_04660 [Mucilaginibacter sabulilitoris]
MEKAINYYELKQELTTAGFQNPNVIDDLRKAVFKERDNQQLITCVNDVGFDVDLMRDAHGRLSFIGYSASLGTGNVNWQLQSFQPDVSVTDAMLLLRARASQSQSHEDLSFIPIGKLETQKQIHLLKSNFMNTQNLEFLKKSLLNLGFGDKLNDQLEKQINQKTPDFILDARHEFNQKAVDYQLHFKAGESDGMYFFNKFDAKLNNGKDNEVNQTFYINKGNGITAKEAFNLMEGRAVYKQLYNKDSEPYKAWLQLDPDNLSQNGNKEIKRFNDNYGFDLEEVLTGKGIKEMENAESKENLLRSIRKGNPQQITVTRGKGEVKYFVTASPQFKTVDLYDHQMKKIKREELLKPEQKPANSQKKDQQQKEELPEKKQQSRKRKMTV